MAGLFLFWGGLVVETSELTICSPGATDVLFSTAIFNGGERDMLVLGGRGVDTYFFMCTK